MAYKLEYPYTEEERMNFVVEYNHNQGLRIETVDNYFGDTNFATHYALEANELLVNGEVIINNEYENEQAKIIQKRLVEDNYQQKAKKAYGGILINNAYLFETNETSQSMITASLIGLQNAPDNTTLNWKVYKDNQPLVIPLTKVQLAQLFAFALNMINTAFGLEGVRNNDVAIASVEQLNDDNWVQSFRKETELAFEQINNKVDVVLVEASTENEVK